VVDDDIGEGISLLAVRVWALALAVLGPARAIA
jgi:hypothetical protein